MKKSKLGLLLLSSLALVAGGAITSFSTANNDSLVSVVKAEDSTTTGTITFGSNATKIDSSKVNGTDSQNNVWTITTVGTTSFTQNSGYYQVGSSGNPATSITFTMTLSAEQTIATFSAKFGGFKGTAGTVTLNVGDTTVGTGTLSGQTDLTVSNTSSASGSVLTVSITGISKGVKCYNISYSYEKKTTTNPVATFNTLGGSVISDQEMTSLDSVVTRPSTNPTKTGYIFDDWYTTADGDTKFVFGEHIDSDITIFAHWKNLEITPISNIVSGNYYRVQGVIVAKNGSYIYLQDSSGAIQFHADSSSSISKVSTGYKIALTALASTYSESIIELSGSPIGDIEILDNSTRDVSSSVDAITQYNENTASENYGMYIKLNHVLLLDDFASNSSCTATYGDYEIELFGQSSNMSVSTAFGSKAGTYVDVSGAIINYNAKTPEIVLESAMVTTIYTVTFELNGGTIDNFVSTQTIFAGEKFTDPGTPVKASDENGTYTFDGWYTDEQFINEFDFDSIPSSDVTLYAKYKAGDLPSIDRIKYSTTSASLTYNYEKDVTTDNEPVLHSSSIDVNCNRFDENNSASNDDFTLVVNSGSYSGTPSTIGNKTAYMVFYAGNYADISLSNETYYRITSVELACTAGYAKKTSVSYGDGLSGEATISENVIKFSIPTDQNIKTVRLTNSDSGQSRITNVKVNYEIIEPVSKTTYSYKNAAIRFGGIISKDVWDDIGNVTKYGVMVAKTNDLSGKNIEDVYNDSSYNSKIVDVHTDSNGVDRLTPSIASSNQLSEDKQIGTYYLFNAYLSVSKTDNYTIGISAASYVVVDGTYYFMKQRDTSIVDLAGEYVSLYGESATTIFDGSLYALANL